MRPPSPFEFETPVLKDLAEEDLIIVNAKSVSFHPIKIMWRLPLQISLVQKNVCRQNVFDLKGVAA